jgi:hypothetical protein
MLHIHIGDEPGISSRDSRLSNTAFAVDDTGGQLCDDVSAMRGQQTKWHRDS